jgi:DNA-binding transcriptional MerR regulator
MAPKVRPFELDAHVSGKVLAEMTGEPYSTIDHWTDVGLVPCIRRGRRRLYDPAVAVVRCERIRELQQDGMSLATMRTEFEADRRV